MMVIVILTTLPDLPPRPETAANANFRRRFYARWGHENAIVCGSALRAEYAAHPQTLSIKLAVGGRERYFLGRREVVVDDDNYLVLNEGARYGSLLQGGARPAFSFALFCRPGLPGEVAAQHRRTLAQALDQSEMTPVSSHFAERLRPLRPAGDGPGGAVSARLHRMVDAVRRGQRCELWLEQELSLLVAGLLDDEAGAQAQAHIGARAAQREELHRRLALAVDLIESDHAQPLTLQAMAAVACLSRYHFVREFGRRYGLSPHAYLTRKRAHAAWRQLDAGTTDADEVAWQCGFGSRWSMRRALMRHARNFCSLPAVTSA